MGPDLVFLSVPPQKWGQLREIIRRTDAHPNLSGTQKRACRMSAPPNLPCCCHALRSSKNHSPEGCLHLPCAQVEHATDWTLQRAAKNTLREAIRYVTAEQEAALSCVREIQLGGLCENNNL